MHVFKMENRLFFIEIYLGIVHWVGEKIKRDHLLHEKGRWIMRKLEQIKKKLINKIKIINKLFIFLKLKFFFFIPRVIQFRTRYLNLISIR